MGVAGCLFFLYALVAIHKAKFQTCTDRVRDIGVFRVKEMLLGDTDGYRILQTNNGKVLQLLSKSSKKKIKAYLLFERQPELLQWIDGHIRDLDRIDVERQTSDAMEDSSLGSDEGERSEMLRKAPKWGKAFNLAAFALGLWALIGRGLTTMRSGPCSFCPLSLFMRFIASVASSDSTSILNGGASMLMPAAGCCMPGV